MDKNKAKEYEGLKVKLILKNGYKFAGEVLKVEDVTLTIEDWKSGSTEIDIPSISVLMRDDR